MQATSDNIVAELNRATIRNRQLAIAHERRRAIIESASTRMRIVARYGPAMKDGELSPRPMGNGVMPIAGKHLLIRR